MPGIAGVKRRMCLPGHRAGHPGRVRISDIAALPVQAGAAMRHRRLFHPIGVLANGTIERIAATGEGLPMVPGEVVGRVSKGVGLPGALPDIAGVAWRMPPPLPPSIPWDVLLASTTGGALGRILLRPVTSWSGATFSTLMPLGFRGGCGGYAPGWPPSSKCRAFRWTPSPTKSGAAESISTSSRPQAPAISGRWRGCRCVRSSRPAGTWRSTRRCTARQV